jgi:formyl-CoA transferase
MATAAGARPLAGVRILDLTRALAGPFCATILADLGAEVVKVEPTPNGEMSRGWGPFDRGISVYYLAVNRNKRSLALDFRAKPAIGLLRDLAGKADVLLENFKPGTMEAMGLSCETLRAASPGLIYANITGFGRTGPYGDWPGLDQIAQGMSGLMSITGQTGGEATRVGVPIGDMIAGMWTAIGVQAALVQRAETGIGQRVETSLLAGLVGMLSVQGQRYLSLGEVPKPAGNDHPVICPYGTFEAADGPFNMAAATDDMWRKLCTLVGLPEIAAHPDYIDNAARMKNRVALIALLNSRFAANTRAHWTAALVELGLPAGPIYDLAAVFDDPQVRATHLVEEVAHPILGPLRQLASPIRMDALDQSVRTPPPLLGEHSETVLREWGIDPHRIRDLVASGCVISKERSAA